jgi:hypothetical protein
MVENNNMEKIILKFLSRYYPVSRYKIKDRFKRGILFDDGHIYQISDKKEMDQVYHRLINILKHIFDCNEETCKLVLSQIL